VPPAGAETPFLPNVHAGHEYHYCLEGAFDMLIGDTRLVVNTGDSVYFDSGQPHAMKGRDGKPAKILVIVI